MSPADPAAWELARRARDKLLYQFMAHPEVILIDIGYNREYGKIVLQVHLRRHISTEIIGIPEEVDGIPVQVLVGDYDLE